MTLLEDNELKNSNYYNLDNAQANNGLFNLKIFNNKLSMQIKYLNEVNGFRYFSVPV